MKRPKLSNLKVDDHSTKGMRGMMAHASKIKITINIDREIVESLKRLSTKTSIPYQTLLNKLLKESLDKRGNQESRLDQLENEVAALKKKIAV